MAGQPQDPARHPAAPRLPCIFRQMIAFSPHRAHEFRTGGTRTLPQNIGTHPRQPHMPGNPQTAPHGPYRVGSGLSTRRSPSATHRQQIARLLWYRFHRSAQMAHQRCHPDCRLRLPRCVRPGRWPQDLLARTDLPRPSVQMARPFKFQSREVGDRRRPSTQSAAARLRPT
jgi:hypothetical protein